MQPKNTSMTYADVLNREGQARAGNVFRKAIQARDTRDAAEERWRLSQNTQNEINENVDSAHRQYSADQYIKFANLLKVWYMDVKKVKLDDKVLQKVKSVDPGDNDDLMGIFRAGAMNSFVAEGKKRHADASKQKEIYLGNRQEVASTGESEKMLNTNIWSWGVNQAFIEGAAANSAVIVLITELTPALIGSFTEFEITSGVDLINAVQHQHVSTNLTDPLWHHGDNRPTWYAMELAGLIDLGYTFDAQQSGEDHAKLLPPTDGRVRYTASATQQVGIQAYLTTLNIPTM